MSKPPEIYLPQIRELVRRSLDEDLGSGDVTTRNIVPEKLRAEGTYFARQDLVLAGTYLLPLIYEAGGGVESLELPRRDGERLSDGDPVATVRGPVTTLLTCERVSLNFLQRLSGVATLASRYVREVEGTGVRILDTRKTTPGLRIVEKLAAASGGVVNHRMGLWDAILIKNNHITVAGGVTAAIELVRSAGLPIEVEVRTRAELDEALAAGVDRVLLDNLTPAQAKDEITYIARRTQVELSGGITLENLRAYAEAGPDYISSGAITHGATSMDLNFRLRIL